MLKSTKRSEGYPRTQGYRGRHRPMNARSDHRISEGMTSGMPSRQLDGECEHLRIQVPTPVSGGKELNSSQDPYTVRKPMNEYRPLLVEGSGRRIEKSLAAMDFKK
jgi:hypothetical protein